MSYPAEGAPGLSLPAGRGWRVRMGLGEGSERRSATVTKRRSGDEARSRRSHPARSDPPPRGGCRAVRCAYLVAVAVGRESIVRRVAHATQGKPSPPP